MCDQIFVLRSVVELRKKQGLKTVIAFLVVKKAYDSVERGPVEDERVRNSREVGKVVQIVL